MKFIKYIFIIFILLFFASLLLRRGIDVEVTFKGDLIIDSQIQVEVSVTKNGKPFSPDNMHIQTVNKYNSDDNLEMEIDPYVDGEYLYIFTPNYAGDYFINMTLTDGEVNYNFVEEVNVK